MEYYKPVYQWKAGVRMSVNAQDAGEICARLDAEGRLTQSELVNESRPEDAPLHKAFEWNDSVAAEKYRNVQAGQIIRSVEVVTQHIEKPTRAFVSIEVAPNKREYHDIEVVMRQQSTRDRLLEELKREVAQIERKYSSITELAEAFAALEAEIEELVA